MHEVFSLAVTCDGADGLLFELDGHNDDQRGLGKGRIQEGYGSRRVFRLDTLLVEVNSLNRIKMYGVPDDKVPSGEVEKMMGGETQGVLVCLCWPECGWDRNRMEGQPRLITHTKSLPTSIEYISDQRMLEDCIQEMETAMRTIGRWIPETHWRSTSETPTAFG